jgi:hypothetical protein
MADPLASALTAEPCDECPTIKLGEYLASPYGLRMSVVIDLDFALQVGFHLTLRDIDYRDFRLLRILAEERQKFEIEEMKQKSGHGGE